MLRESRCPCAATLRHGALSAPVAPRVSAAVVRTAPCRPQQLNLIRTAAWFATRQQAPQEQRPVESWELEPDDWDRLDGDYDDQELINAIYEVCLLTGVTRPDVGVL